MKNSVFTPSFWFVVSAVTIASATRFVPHPPNFTAVGAMALFGGACFINKKTAFIIPLAAMLLSDSVIELIYGDGFYTAMWSVYLSFCITVLIGIYIQKKVKFSSVIAASVVSSAIFFALTNFASWAGSTVYPQNFSGLISCYAAAVPFHNNDITSSFALNTFAGDLFFNGILFGAYYFAQAKYPSLTKARL
jgi:hypothetical protein